MQQQFTFAMFLTYVALFVTQGIPAIIGIVALLKLLTITGDGDTAHLNKCLLPLFVILASVSIVTRSWPSILGLAAVCIAIIVMNGLKREN
ncbi:MAG: hypothetical protein HQ515_06410 [Phycisphaeraceae bacterium]|nr:hypothetical protein [Phycisphaeraceae bacterium]